MRVVFNALRQGWNRLWLWRRPDPPVPFEVACDCGQVHRGLRGRRARLAHCPSCGGTLFVFPRSPLPHVPEEQPATAGATGARRRSPWLLPLVAACLTLAVVVVAYILLFSSLLRPSGPSAADAARERRARVPSAQDSLEDGRRLLAAGNFHQASELLSDACNRYPRDADLRQLHRQAELLTLLAHKPLEGIVHEGQMIGDANEWEKRFHREYQGRSLLFDDVVGRSPNGDYQLQTYDVTAADERVYVKLDLGVFASLSLERPRRLLFGARLASVGRERGVWVVRFERDSGVLLTDEGAVSACGLAPLDAELREVLRQQEGWVKGLR
jgi:hypothetical protein